MKKILCFGDSNTFGFNPLTGLRYPQNVRWTGVLQELCKGSYEIIEAGCNNRTAFRNNPEGKIYTGAQILPEYLKQGADIVIIALGSNDLQRQYRTTLVELGYGVETLIKMVKEELPNSTIILVSPSIISDKVLNAKIFSFLFDKNSVEKSKKLAPIYKDIALKNGCKFLDLSLFAPPSEVDGLHYEPETHAEIAKQIYALISDI